MLDIRHHTLAIGKGNSYQAFFDTEALELDVWLPLFHSTHTKPPLFPPIKDDRLFTYQWKTFTLFPMLWMRCKKMPHLHHIQCYSCVRCCWLMEKGGSLKKKVHHWLPPSKELQYSKITISQALFGYHGCILSTSQPDFLEFHNHWLATTPGLSLLSWRLMARTGKQ